MSEYRNALSRISFNYGLMALGGDTNEIMDDKFNEDVNVIKKLIDEQEKIVEVKVNDMLSYVCEHCLSEVSTYYNKNNCGCCGYELDWSVDDD